MGAPTVTSLRGALQENGINQDRSRWISRFTDHRFGGGLNRLP
jgi:hypothetical protein